MACEILNRICVIDQNDYLKKRRQQELNAAQVKLRQEAVAEHFQQLKGYAQVYQDATTEEKRRIVSALIERVTVSRGYEIHIQFRVGLDVLNNLDD